MKYVFLILILLISGCISSNLTTIKELREQPENFTGKNIAIEGYLKPFLIDNEKVWIKGFWNLYDSEGRNIPITSIGNDSFLYGAYKISGTFSYFEVCECIVRRDFFDGLVYDWEPYPKKGYLYPADYCNKKYSDILSSVEYRCRSEPEKFYYINSSSLEKMTRIFFDYKMKKEEKQDGKKIENNSVFYYNNSLFVDISPVYYENGTFFIQKEIGVRFLEIPSSTGWIEIRFASLNEKEEPSQIKRFREPFEGQEIFYDLRGLNGTYYFEIRDVYQDMPSEGDFYVALISTDYFKIR